MSATKTIRNEHLTGERALFKARDLRVETCTFDEGESPLKESRNVEVEGSVFGWRYPLWYSNRARVTGSVFMQDVRAGIWYSRDVELADCTFAGPKGIRKCHDVRIRRTTFPNAEETLWWNDGVELEDVVAKGDYFCMGSNNIRVHNLQLDGKYSFDGCHNVVVEDSRLITKDAFWNCENVVVRNSFIVAEYVGWNARNITFENCTIQSLQGFCYIDGLTIRNCKLVQTDLAFEYCTDVDVELSAPIVSVKNPLGGRIVAPRIGEVIFDDPDADPSATTIVQTGAVAGSAADKSADDERPRPCSFCVVA